MADRDAWNAVRYDGGSQGHYESYFQRANHPSERRAFWIRYTIFSPAGRPDQAIGERWAIYFDLDGDRIVAVRDTVPFADCRFATSGLDARIGDATLTAKSLAGSSSCEGHSISWDLEYSSPEPPLLLLPESLYRRRLPKAKALVGSPGAVFNGSLEVDGARVDIDDWVGSQNHNWGSKHTDAYAWGQVAGFDDDPDVFLECSTARLKIGPLWTPRITLVVIRLGDETIGSNGLVQGLRNKGRYDFFQWSFEAVKRDVRVRGTFEAPASSFIGLTYLNPPGGDKACLNCKVARCELTVERGGQTRTLTTRSRAAFEILTDDGAHGVPVLAAD